MNPALDDPASLRAGLRAAEAAFAPVPVPVLDLARQHIAWRDGGASRAVEAPLHPGPLSRDDWRAAHRSGRPSIIGSDAELRAFVEARLGAMTFTRIVAEVAATFPEGRRTSLSALSRSWRRTRGLDRGKRRGRP
jgi:hypothetical protein